LVVNLPTNAMTLMNGTRYLESMSYGDGACPTVDMLNTKLSTSIYLLYSSKEKLIFLPSSSPRNLAKRLTLRMLEYFFTESMNIINF